MNRCVDLNTALPMATEGFKSVQRWVGVAEWLWRRYLAIARWILSLQQQGSHAYTRSLASRDKLLMVRDDENDPSVLRTRDTLLDNSEVEDADILRYGAFIHSLLASCP